jgi:hypothetical protein
MEEFAMGTTAYQSTVDSRQGGSRQSTRWLRAFQLWVIRSKAALDTFIATQDSRLGMQPFYSSLRSAQIDFSKEALVLLRVNMPSESIDVSFKGGWIRSFPVIVNTGLVDGITLLVGGKETFMASFDDQPKAIAVLPPPNLQNVTPRKRRSEARAITAHALEALRLRGNREIVPSASALASGAEAFETQLKTAIGKCRFKTTERAVDILPACTTYTFVADL